MNWLVGFVWLAFGAIQVNSGVIPEEVSDQESDTHVPEATYFSQVAVLPPNQNYNQGIQHQNNFNSYQNSDSRNSQNNAAVSFQQNSANYQQQNQLPTMQQSSYSVNSFRSQQNEPLQQQHQSLQYNTNFNAASNTTISSQTPSYSANVQTQQNQEPFQNVQASYEQNNYNTQVSFSSDNERENKQLQPTDKQNSETVEDARRTHPLDIIDNKSKSAKKIPLVLITIQKNKLNGDKSKTNMKRQNSKEEYGPQISTSNIPVSQKNIDSDHFSNLEPSSENAFQSNYNSNRDIQNNAQASTENAQQQYNAPAQTYSSAEQVPRGIIIQKNFTPLAQYRYPILAGKKLESSEWKPVDTDSRNFNSGFLQSSDIQQRSYASNQPDNGGYNAQNANSVQTLQQSTNADRQQYQQSLPNTNSNYSPNDSNQGKTGDVKYQLASAYVQQANFNVGSDSGTGSGSFSNIPEGGNYFVVNNVQRSQEVRPQQNEGQRAQVSVQNDQPNLKIEQYSFQVANNKNFGLSDQNQRQSASYQVGNDKSSFAYGATNQQNPKMDNTFQSTSNRNANTYYNQRAIEEHQNKFLSRNSPLPQNIASQSQLSSNSEARSNQLQFPNNPKNYVQENTLSATSQGVVNNGLVSSLASGQFRKFEQQKSNSNNFNAQPQETNFGRSFTRQNFVSLAEEDKNRSNLQNTNQQLSGYNNATPFQQTANTYASTNSNKNLQNAYSSFASNNQQSNPNYVQSGVKTSTQRNFVQNQGYNQNMRPANPSYAANSENRNIVFQNDVNNNRQPSGDYRSSNMQFNDQKGSVNSERNPSYLKQSVASSGNNRASVLNNYGSSTSQGETSYNNPQNSQAAINSDSSVNKNTNTNYNNPQNKETTPFQSNSYRTSYNPTTNYQSSQQRLSVEGNTGSEQYNYRRGTSPSTSFKSNQNTNYGSLETQDSVIGTKLDKKTENEQQYSAGNNYNQFDDNRYDGQNKFSQTSQVYSRSQENSNAGATNKVTRDDEGQDSAPEALLLVLVSAKKSAIEDHPAKEKDDMNEGYESAPDEIMELLSEEANRQMIIRSLHEASEAAYADDMETQDEDSERALESDDNES